MEMAAHRRRRVRRLKRGLILTLLLLIFLPTVLCVVLFFKMRAMDRSMEELAGRVETLAEQTAAQQSMMQQLLESMQTTGHGTQEETEAERKLSGFELKTAEISVEETEESEETAAEPAHKVYLTFDDGPSANTEKILDILDSYGVKATFFVVGKEDDTSKEALAQIVERGHSLGMHSYSHKYAEIYRSVDNFAADFEKLRDYLEEVTGVRSTLYRFPGGSSNKVTRRDIHEFIDYLESQGVSYYDWNISSGDASRRQLTADELLKNATEGIGKYDTAVILMHDAVGKPSTVEALPAIIENVLALEDTVILPITEDTEPVQHIQKDNKN